MRACPASVIPASSSRLQPSLPASQSSPSPAPTPRSARSSPRACPLRSFTFSASCRRKPEPAAHDSKLSPQSHASSALTLIFYEAPHRIAETLADIEATWGSTTRIVAARELTKLHEEFLRGTVAEVRAALTARDRIRGEFVLLLEAAPRGAAEPLQSQEKIADRIARLQSEAGIDEKEALKRLARELGQSKSEVYRELQRERARRK